MAAFVPVTEYGMPRSFAAVLAGVLFVGGCAGAVESSKTEDGSRRVVPVPICLKAMPRHGTGVVASLTPDDYWAMILPSYDAGAKTVDRSAADCTGRVLLADPLLVGASGAGGAIRVTDADTVIGSAPDGFKVVWLRTHHFSDGSAAGPLALARPKESYAEVYSIGLYRGGEKSSQFGFERLGSDIIVTATDERCADAKPGQNCETMLHLFLSRGGKLEPSAEFAVDRVFYGSAPGISGTVQYRLSASPIYSDKSVRVVEQVVVRDGAQSEIRKSDLERTYVLKNRTRLVANTESLWDQAVGASPGARPAPPPPPPPPPPHGR